jgi:glycosyltransferase involved in cell wall biosynthesis
MILDGYCLSDSKLKFVIIGNIGNGYGKHLVGKYKNENRIIFLGGIFDEAKVKSITRFCTLYFHGHSVGGTNPSLLDAMATRAPLAIHNNAFNKSIIRGNALLFTDAKDVCDLINSNNYSNQIHIDNNYSTITNEFSWKQIIDQYEHYFLACYKTSQEYYPLKHEGSILYKR